MVNVVSATATEVSGATVSVELVELPHEVPINVSAAIAATVYVAFLIIFSPYLMLLMRI
jgi:post-segregation antitoxin (ccd killing protein)